MIVPGCVAHPADSAASALLNTIASCKHKVAPWSPLYITLPYRSLSGPQGCSYPSPIHSDFSHLFSFTPVFVFLFQRFFARFFSAYLTSLCSTSIPLIRPLYLSYFSGHFRGILLYITSCCFTHATNLELSYQPQQLWILHTCLLT